MPQSTSLLWDMKNQQALLQIGVLGHSGGHGCMRAFEELLTDLLSAPNSLSPILVATAGCAHSPPMTLMMQSPLGSEHGVVLCSAGI